MADNGTALHPNRGKGPRRRRCSTAVSLQRGFDQLQCTTLVGAQTVVARAVKSFHLYHRDVRALGDVMRWIRENGIGNRSPVSFADACAAGGVDPVRAQAVMFGDVPDELVEAAKRTMEAQHDDTR
tara:strand:+ start:482 stop:859 length:378 start_codon:yes stop_codon:yes gene_type:complete